MLPAETPTRRGSPFAPDANVHLETRLASVHGARAYVFTSFFSHDVGGVQREHVLRTRRGHERLVAPGTGAKTKLTSADRVLLAVLHLRKLATRDLLGQLFNTTAMTISRAAKDVHPLLAAHGVHLPASTARFRTQEDIARFLDPDRSEIKPTR